MLKIWGRKNSINVQKVLWCYRELDLDHERVDTGGTFGGTEDSEYLTMNPNGLAPTIYDDSLTLWKSSVVAPTSPPSME